MKLMVEDIDKIKSRIKLSGKWYMLIGEGKELLESKLGQEYDKDKLDFVASNTIAGIIKEEAVTKEEAVKEITKEPILKPRISDETVALALKDILITCIEKNAFVRYKQYCEEWMNRTRAILQRLRKD